MLRSAGRGGDIANDGKIDEDAGSGANVIETLAEWYEQLATVSTDPAGVLIAKARATDETSLASPSRNFLESSKFEKK